jgi:hypothetical protein
MMDWAEKTGVKTGSSTAKPTGQEGKNAPISTPRLEQTLERHIISMEHRSPSLFSEDDSLYDNFLYLRPQSPQQQQQQRNPIDPPIITPYKNSLKEYPSPNLSAVPTDLESVRELHNVSVNSRDMGRRRWRLENTITNISPMMEKKRHVAIILSPSRVYIER